MKKIFIAFIALFFTASLFAEAPIVHDISAKAGKNKKISILWTIPEETDPPITKLLLYRDTKQISSFTQVKNLKPIATLDKNITAYIDTVSDFSDYFYAVVAVTTEPYDLILLSFNSTVTGVHLKSVQEEPEGIQKDDEKLYPEGTLREIPLPYIDITDSMGGNKKISDSTVEKAKSLITTTPKISPLLKPYIFEEDLISPDGGDDYLLFDILKNSFIQRKYTEAVTQLVKLTGTNINDTTRNRAYFYLGEAYYFLGNFKEAVKTFVRVRSEYPELVKAWLDSSLDRI